MSNTKSLEEIRATIHGPVNSIPTPYLADGEIDWDGVRNIIDCGIAGGSAVCLLTAGNSNLMYLSDEELRQLTSIMVEHVAGRALTVAATPLCGARQAVAFAKWCKSIGVDMLMPTPFSNADLQSGASGIAEFYRSVAQVLPVMLVGYPDHAVLDALVDEPNVVAFKEDGTLEYAIRTTARYTDRYCMITGGQLSRHYAEYPYGANAFFSCYHTFAPEPSNRYWAAVQENDDTTAVSILKNVDLPLFRMNTTYPGGFQQVWRAILSFRGIAARYVRTPMVNLSEESLEAIKAEAAALGLL